MDKNVSQQEETPDYVTMLIGLRDDVNFPSGFNSFPKQEKQDWAKNEIEKIETELTEKLAKERKKTAIYKAALTVGLGAGTGILTGLVGDSFAGTGGTTKSALEQANQPKGTSVESLTPKISSRLSAAETADTSKDIFNGTYKIPNQSEPTALDFSKGPTTPATSASEIPGFVSVEHIFFSDPSILHHEAIAGDSVWKILDKTLENNDQFKGMTEAQKTYVLSILTNKVVQDPTTYGVGDGGSLNIGDKTDFTKLFENSNEIKSLIKKAVKTVTPGSLQEVSILKHNTQISSWLNDHPGEKLTNDKVAEILATKSKAPVELTLKPSLIPESPTHLSKETGSDVYNQHTWGAGESPSQFIESPNQDISNKIPDYGIPKDVPKYETPNQLGGETIMAGGLGMAGMTTVGAMDRNSSKGTDGERLRLDIEEARKRITELEAGGTKTGNPNLVRSSISDARFSRAADVNPVESAFRSEIDSIYGKNGFLGFGRLAGIDSLEWKEIANLPVDKVLRYYTGDSTRSGFSAEIVEKLARSQNHKALVDQTQGLIGVSKGIVRPFENESVEQFIKRLGEYVLRTNAKNLSKAA